MIPDFKTYIKESIWSDIQKRSAGDTVRREDDVNHMNFDTFADYIRDNYSEKGNWFSVAESDDGKSRHIEIDIIYRGEIDLSFNVVEGKLYNILVQGNKNYVDIPGLKEIFNVNIIGSSTFGVYEKNWTISNNTFVKLIEFFLKKKTNESIWSDIQKRSAGDIVRKEDDVNQLDKEGLYEYILSHYELIDNGFKRCKMSYGSENMFIPLTEYIDILLSYDRQEVHCFFNLKAYPSLYPVFRKKYNVYEVAQEHYVVGPKDKYTNQFFIDVIDYIIENAETILRKKNVNESLWSDIQKRSAGESVRKEDDIELLDMTGLYDYILAHYELTDKNREMTYGSAAMSITISSDGDEILLHYGFHEVHLYFDLPKYKLLETELCKQFNVSPVGHDIDHYVVEQGGKYTNQFFIDVLDCIIANRKDIILRKKELNESIWSDIQKRSSGETIRKEDDVDNLDMEGFYDYLNNHYEVLENKVIRKYDDLHAILVPIVSSELNFHSTSLHFIEINFNPDDVTETKIFMSLRSLSEIPYIDESLRKAFCVVDRDKNSERGKHVEIYPKDGGESTIVTNTFFLEVLDFILKEAEGKYTILLKKK